MSRIRLNQEYRNKIANRIKAHLQQEDTHEKQTYDNLKGDQIQLNDDAWKMAEKIVRRHYTEDDVEKAYYLQNKFENVSTIAKDSCFHFHYMGNVEERDYDNNPVIREKANDMLQGYNLIEKEKNVVYSIVRYEQPLKLEREDKQ